MHCRHYNKFDVVLFDDANEVNEALSTMMLLFSPSSVILFGDPYKKSVDELRIQQKYPKHNLNQSMFERIRKSKRCVLHLDSQYRFGDTISRFVSKCFYGQQNVGCRKFQPLKPLDGINIFHRKTDGFCFKFIKNMIQHIAPTQYKYTIIYPPNIRRDAIEANSLE